MENEYYPFVNLPLPFPPDALEPFIDGKTMMLHHDRHLKTYIENLNAFLKDRPRLQKLSLPALIQTAGHLPREEGTTLRNNAGGVFNHRFFFHLLAPVAAGGGAGPAGQLEGALRRRFGGVAEFTEAFEKAALSVFGSGYAWLVKRSGRLCIVTTPNQNCPLEMGQTPILCVDVWEHAYYLKHYNERAAYLKDWWQVVDWGEAERNFLLGQ